VLIGPQHSKAKKSPERKARGEGNEGCRAQNKGKKEGGKKKGFSCKKQSPDVVRAARAGWQRGKRSERVGTPKRRNKLSRDGPVEKCDAGKVIGGDFKEKPIRDDISRKLRSKRGGKIREKPR